MMATNQLLCTVKLVPSNNHFIRLPNTYLASLAVNISGIPVVQILLAENTSKSYFCSVGGSSTLTKEQVVEVGPSVGLKNNASVLVQKPEESEVGVAVKVVVSPASFEDWQILQLNQRRVERSVLDQVRIVQPGQKLRINIDRIPLVLNVKTVEPERVAVVLQQMTEFVIDVPDEYVNNNSFDVIDSFQEYEEKHAESKRAYDDRPHQEPSSLLSKLWRPISAIFETGMTEDLYVKESFKGEFSSLPFKGAFRVHVYEADLPYTCIISKRSFQETKSCFIAQLTKIPITFPSDGTSPIENENVFVKIKVSDSEDFLNGRIYLSETLLKWKGIPLASQVFIQSVPYQDTYLDNIVLDLVLGGPSQPTPEESEHINNMLETDTSIFPISCLLETPSQTFQVLGKEKQQFLWVAQNKKAKFDRDSKRTEDFKFSSIDSCFVKNESKIEPNIHSEKLKECLQYLNSNFLTTKDVGRHSHLLVSGNSGTGKTCFVKELTSLLGSSGNAVASKITNCISLKGKRGDMVKKQIETNLEELEYKAPGVYILDNLDSLMPAVEEDRPDEHSTTLAAWLAHLLTDTASRSTRVAVIATVKSSETLNDRLCSVRGSLPFRKQVHLQIPGKTEIIKLMKFFLMSENLDISNKFLSLAEGCHPSDLKKVAERIVTKYDKVTSENLDLEMKEFVPISRWGQNLKPKDLKSIEDVGSLDKAKDVLIQTLLWPSKYPEVFSKCGVRLPRGILLYGAPGTGKTLLAEAVSSYTGLNFIPVKGPELLSKYIGASEANVRDLFQRAQAVKPCILFFDEFESLAPKRGHDSTGVTDRVVNQLLTQLDGVEGLEGVWIMAASSRPDLIDPALLRPGRLDKSVLCPIPDEDDRLDILKVLTRNIELDSDVNLHSLAESTSGLTGADLRAMIYTAQLLSHKAATSKPKKVDFLDQKNITDHEEVKQKDREKNHPRQLKPSLKKSPSEEKPSLTQENFLEAAQQTQASVTPSEAKKYENIYARFQSGKDDNSAQQQKATLA